VEVATILSMLKNLELFNFRNYSKASFDFEKTTILIGPNGIGKTNIIEAIYMISTGRSWRTNRDNELINWGNDFMKILITLEAQEAKTLEMLMQKEGPATPQKKSVKMNGVKKRLAEFLGVMPAVLFSPEELRLIDGSPVHRRRFLDILLCEMEKKYVIGLLDLAKIIKSRNKLLFFIKIGQAEMKELEFWDEKLITLGSFIIRKREKVIDYINKNLSKTYQNISGAGENLEIKYKPTVKPEEYEETLIAGRDREIENTATLFGPHRDDFTFYLDGKDITTFGSRGEFRSAVLALKIAELDYFTTEGKTRPILLLDDIFSELDRRRRMHLSKIIQDCQTIITTTDLDHVEENLRGKAKTIAIGGE